MDNTQKIVILNSRQELYPCCDNIWIQKTYELLNTLKDTNSVIVSSTGMSTWDVVTIIATKLQIPLILYIQNKLNTSEDEAIAQLVTEFKLNKDLITFEFISENSKKLFQTIRDSTICNIADVIIPISIRPDGNLENLISKQNTKVDNRHKTIYKKRATTIAYKIDTTKVSKEIQELSNLYLFHWTRASKQKWFFENQFDYYSDILKYDFYPRRAIDSLTNIITANTIFATSTHMPQNIPTVSFTSLHPTDMIPHFRWRSRYQEMSFEPYGIGIKKEVALKNNIQQVLYYDKNLGSSTVQNSQVWLTQSKGKITNWEDENEFRHLGDFSLCEIRKEDLLLCTRYKKEAEMLQEMTEIQSISFLA